MLSFFEKEAGSILVKKNCGGAPVGKNLDHHSYGLTLEDFYFGISWRSPSYHIAHLRKYKFLTLCMLEFVLFKIYKVILGFEF